MKAYPRKILKIIVAMFALIAVLAALLCLWYYKTPYTALKDKLSIVFPFPVAFVNGNPLYARTLVERMDSASIILGEENIDSTYNEVQSQILDQMISEAETQVVARQHGVFVSKAELAEQFNAIKQQNSGQSTSSLANLLTTYHLSEDQFKNQILKPELLLTDLTIWFNAQPELNKKEYQLAESLRTQIKNANNSTSTFASLAQQFSQDNNSKNMQGDLGFLDSSELLPELRTALDSSHAGDILIVPSRYGIHIFQILSNDIHGNNGLPRIEARQIFLQPEDFNSWYQQQIKNIKIKKII